MSDNIDRASELEQQQREISLKKHRALSNQPSALYCEDCDEPIPEKRRQSMQGCTRCIDCQTAHELRQKGYRQM